MRGDVFTRQLRLLQLLESRSQGVEVGEAAAELGTGRRTVYRDLRVLEDAGIPLTSDVDGGRARWRMLEGYRHRLQLTLTWSEMLALSVGSRLLEGLSGTLFHTSAVSALEKLRASFPKPVAQRVRAHEAAISTDVGGRDYTSRGELVRLLVEAIEQRWTLRARYRSPRSARTVEAAERRIDPYHLRVSGQGLYVLAHCHRAGAVRTFLVDRFQELVRTGETFAPPLDFRTAHAQLASFEMWTGPSMQVQAVVSAPHADLLLERKVHPSQVTHRREDGAVDVMLAVPHCPPLLTWLTSLGPSLRELWPEPLRQEVARLHRETLEALGEANPVATRASSRSA